MANAAPQEKDDYIVLYIRVHKSEQTKLLKLAKDSDRKLAVIAREMMKIGLATSIGFADPVDHIVKDAVRASEQLESIENILVAHSKQSMEDIGKILHTVVEIHAKQLDAQAAAEKETVPEGVLLLPLNKEDRKGTFFCQKCGTPTPNKKKHTIQVQEEKVVVGDCCYFNDSYKELVRKIL